MISVTLWLAVLAANGAVTGIYFNPLIQFSYTNTGAYPCDTPVLAADGTLYGTTYGGGTNGAGVIFKISTNSSLTVLHNFSTNAADGAYTYAGLTAGQNGILYGVTTFGGTNNEGTIFEITTNGVFTQLYSFGTLTNDLGYAADGSQPHGSLILGHDGNFYGVTTYGGDINEGTVFEYSTNGILTTLHSFDGDGTNDDGEYPYLSLVEGNGGVFYGTTYSGGTNDDGTIFQIATNGSYSPLFEFNGTNGYHPYAGLSFGNDGNLYGTTVEGGTNSDGTVFQISTNGSFTTLVQFNGSDGLLPIGGVVMGPDNVLYGTTYEGGAGYSATGSAGYGTLFAVTTNGVLTDLYSLSTGSSGYNSYCGVTRGSNGDLYGTMAYGGKSGFGTLYYLRDTNNPTISIVTPTTGEHWSNAVFNVTGTAKDNVSLANVYYALNGSAWSNAATANSWSNWTAAVSLTPGTNILQAYAVDGAGNNSSTNTVSLVYVLSSTLTVLTNGPGTISPNYNNALLQIGVAYSMTATPASGFGFVNWTDGSGDVLTNGATLKFLMESNLTFVAHFVDITKPTLTVTAPTANERWSNSVFTVTGTAKDNVSVANVYFDLNGSGWSNAVTANNWSNWTATVSLTPGTNNLQAYAVDGAGNNSTTNNLNFDYVLAGQLRVIASGLGTISPNYSNALLEIGGVYSIKATPASGFLATNWTISTNQLIGRITNSATVEFMMVSNLILQVDFADVTKPTLSITSPTAGQHLTNALATFSGKASDNWGLSGVWYQLNNGAWSLANTTNGYTNWNATAGLIAGTNTFKAYAIDFGTNYSATNSLSVVSSNTFELQLNITAGESLAGNGLGFSLATSPGLDGIIQVSTNLVDWSTLTNFVGTGTNLMLFDGAATNYSQRFYRAVVP